MTREIPLLLRGEIVGSVIVDDEDYERLSQHAWHPHPKGYAQRSCKIDGKRKCMLIHQEVVGAIPEGHEVDHKDRDKRNNQRCNLRVVTSSTNQHNRSMPSTNTSGVKGVCWIPRIQRWRAHMKFQGKNVLCQNFKYRKEAIEALESKRRELGLVVS